MSDQKFPKGVFAKAPHQNAPEFVKAKLSINVKTCGNWLRELNKDNQEWVNLEVKAKKDGEYYVVVDDWKPDKGKQAEKPGEPDDDFGDKSIPF